MTQQELKPSDLVVKTLGECQYRSPMTAESNVKFVDESVRVRYHQEVGPEEPAETVSFEKAGPRSKIFFDPTKTTAAIVTCGGLCPGLNNVIRSVTLELRHNYGVPKVLGIRQGYRGLDPDLGIEPILLSQEKVTEVQNLGGSLLSSSRGPRSVERMVDYLVDQSIDLLFCVGGDGTQRGAAAIASEVADRGLTKSVIGIPKTIDNDILYVSTSFGYATAVEKAEEVIRAAHVEALGAPNGVGLVKLMGRDAGYVAAGAALASAETNFVLVPEVPFPLEDPGGFLESLVSRIKRRGHAVVVVAEGAGQHLFKDQDAVRDASGNVKHVDIGVFLRDRIRDHFQEVGVELNLKYLDPSYVVRSVPANCQDRILCDQLARMAAHAAMAGKTAAIIGSWASYFVHVPIPIVVTGKKRIDVHGDFWNAVLNATGQPRW